MDFQRRVLRNRFRYLRSFQNWMALMRTPKVLPTSVKVCYNCHIGADRFEALRCNRMFNLSGSRFGFFLRKNLSVVVGVGNVIQGMDFIYPQTKSPNPYRGFRLTRGNTQAKTPSCDRRPITVYLDFYTLFFGVMGPLPALAEEGAAPVCLRVRLE